MRSSLPANWLWWPKFVFVILGVETLLLLHLYVSRMAVGPEMGLPMFDGLRGVLQGDEVGGGVPATVLWINLVVTLGLWISWRSARSTGQGGATSLLVALVAALVLLSLSFLARKLARSAAPFAVEAVIERTVEGTYVVSPPDPRLESMLDDPEQTKRAEP